MDRMGPYASARPLSFFALALFSFIQEHGKGVGLINGCCGEAIGEIKSTIQRGCLLVETNDAFPEIGKEIDVIVDPSSPERKVIIPKDILGKRLLRRPALTESPVSPTGIPPLNITLVMAF